MPPQPILTGLRRLAARLFALAVLALTAAAGYLLIQRLDSRPRTDDAFLEADIVHLAPEISGRIIALAAVNNRPVHAGDLLFTIDPRPFMLRRDAARAQTQALQARIADTANELAAQGSRADAADSGVAAARNQLTLAASTLARLEPLLAKGFVTAEQVDQARTARDNARAAVDQAGRQARAARQGIGTLQPLEEQLAAARANEALAEHDLSKTEVRAPFDGLVIGLNVTVGEFASAGHPLFTLIDTGRWYAVANFRETEIGGMPAGTPATIYLLAEPDRPLTGHVDSIGWGVLPDDASLVNGVPRIAKTLDWVRLAQRFPVRVLIDQPPPDLMRIGASAVVVVHRDAGRS